MDAFSSQSYIHRKPAISLDPKQTISRVKNTNPDQLDREFYVKAYRDVKPRFVDPYTHYYTMGKQEGRLPNANRFTNLYPQFDFEIYSTRNGDLSQMSHEELMSHYHHHGRHESRTWCKKPSSKSSPVPTPISDPVEVAETQPLPPLPLVYVPTRRHTSCDETRYINTSNFSKIAEGQKTTTTTDDIDPVLQSLLDKRVPNKPIYLVLAEWGYPPFGGGECWLIDTTKWLSERGFACYYLYFNDPAQHADFDHYEIQPTLSASHAPSCIYLKCPRNIIPLLTFLSRLKPDVISHQGIKRNDYLKIANLLEKPFMTGFCFWQDIIKMPAQGKDIYNQNMTDKRLTPDDNFRHVHSNASFCYVASPFMANIVKKVQNVDLTVINTISDPSLYKFSKPDNAVYVTVINICGLKGGNILESIVKNTSIEIPFLLVDSQDVDAPLNQRLKQILINRNASEKSYKSVYMRGPINDIKHIYQQTRILLVPTLVDETFCRVAYEGMMNHLPILSTKNGNLRYLVDGYADFMTQAPDEWSRKINQIYNDDEYLQTMRSRAKNINPSVDQTKFITNVYRCLMSQPSTYFLSKSVGLLCPWADQGLGVQCREYYEILEKNGFSVSVYSFKPYHATPSNTRLQVDAREWDYRHIHYAQEVREKINAEDFITYLYTYKVKTMIIVETCYPKVFELARICRMLSIDVIAIPNLETLRYTEILQHDVFNKIICNNHMTYKLLSKFFPQKARCVGFRILNKNFNTDKIWSKTPSFFCSGGLNSISRKNIDKIIEAFKEIEGQGKLNGFKLYIYIQGVELPQHIERFKSNNIIFSVGPKNYSEIVDLYKKHDIFVHMGDHEGLGLGFYESIVCGTPVMTIDTPPNNEIIHDGVNGWVVPCEYAPLNDNPEGIVYRASLQVDDIRNTFAEIIRTYNRDQMYQSTIMDYINRYPVDVYSEQIVTMIRGGTLPL
jgi:glycosyltransferase involved in cell wall biosynthesis